MTALKTILWLSAGVSSAISWVLMREQIDAVLYIDIDDQHKDSIRFCDDIARYIGGSYITLKSPFGSVSNVCRSGRYINGPGGARCTTKLKRDVRRSWEQEASGPFRYVWGLDLDEKDRAEKITEAMDQCDHVFPLIDRGLKKQDAHGLLVKTGVSRPEMYNMGYKNNNCIGCVKGGMGYWNKIRNDFPEVFADRAKMEREIGATCINGVFLDELDPSAGRADPPISEDCGVFCYIHGKHIGKSFGGR